MGAEEEAQSHTFYDDGTAFETCFGSFDSGLSKEGDSIYLGLNGETTVVTYGPYDEDFVGTIEWDADGARASPPRLTF